MTAQNVVRSDLGPCHMLQAQASDRVHIAVRLGQVPRRACTRRSNRQPESTPARGKGGARRREERVSSRRHHGASDAVISTAVCSVARARGSVPLHSRQQRHQRVRRPL